MRVSSLSFWPEARALCRMKPPLQKRLESESELVRKTPRVFSILRHFGDYSVD